MEHKFTVYIAATDPRPDAAERIQREICRHLYQVFGPMLKGVGHADK